MQVELLDNFSLPSHYVGTAGQRKQLQLTEEFLHRFLSLGPSALRRKNQSFTTKESQNGLFFSSVYSLLCIHSTNEFYASILPFFLFTHQSSQAPWTIFHEAVSPAFECIQLENAECGQWKLKNDSESESTFVQGFSSRNPSFRVFRRERDGIKYVLLGFGVVQALAVWYAIKFWLGHFHLFSFMSPCILAIVLIPSIFSERMFE